MNTKSIDDKVVEAVRLAYENAPAVKQRLDEAGITPDDIQGIADLVKIPIQTKDEMVLMQQADPPFGGLLSVPLSEVSHIFFSPGPLYEPGPTADDPAWEMAVLSLQRGGFEADDIILNSLSYHLVPAGYLFDVAFTRLGAAVIPGGTGNSDLQLQMMRDLGATGYVGTPSFLMSLIQKAEEKGLDFRRDFKLRRAITTAEPLPPSLRQTLVDVYGIHLTNAYATAELHVLATNDGPGMAMQLLPEPVVQVVNPETGQLVGPGETGEIVATNFSKHYPLIRVGTGDMAMNIDPKPGESLQEERSIILVGRRGEAVKVRGMFLHPNQLRFAAGQVPGVVAMQAVVSRPELRDQFDLRVVIEAGADAINVAEGLKKAVNGLCRVRVDEVHFVAGEALPEGSPAVIDERTWD
ncbi:MAG: AMP-binding protein [Candidatus Promineifilaceae bacterium]|nr:AMP-binding protein [Candidatus Promineifilaceae bacterium]